MKHFFAFLAGLFLLPVLMGCGSLAALETVAVSGEVRQLPILMYHSVLKDPDRRGKFVISPESLEKDIRWLIDHGYETVVMEDVIDFVKGSGDLPEKPVMLTFDDGYLNNLTYVLPLLERYDCRGVISIVGLYTQRFSETPDPNPNYAHVTWEDIAALSDSGRFEIQNHSYDMHGEQGRMGSGRKKGESESDYRAVFTADVEKLQTALTEKSGVTPTVFTYPFGVIDSSSRTFLRDMGFSGTLTCYEKINTITKGDSECLWGLGRYNRHGDLDTEAFMARLFQGC